jgi:hypothetical protein
MKKYKIYAGLSGIFGGEEYITTKEFENEDAATEYAFAVANKIYEEHEKSFLLSRDDIAHNLKLKYGKEVDNEDIEIAYNEEKERWLDYRVEEVD